MSGLFRIAATIGAGIVARSNSVGPASPQPVEPVPLKLKAEIPLGYVGAASTACLKQAPWGSVGCNGGRRGFAPATAILLPFPTARSPNHAQSTTVCRNGLIPAASASISKEIHRWARWQDADLCDTQCRACAEQSTARGHRARHPPAVGILLSFIFTWPILPTSHRLETRRVQASAFLTNLPNLTRAREAGANSRRRFSFLCFAGASRS